ncbi:hypothetical protein O6P43_032180 [Quillaja saponaria]|uniref:Uncharacterized protein n=1 Tax=Quillaja saponaria TaxID=32244 RepID=A0AAD7KYP0_QUISA|nr:hypothetical protein O6P43_032180 [Quillaja saponaria]
MFDPSKSATIPKGGPTGASSGHWTMASSDGLKNGDFEVGENTPAHEDHLMFLSCILMLPVLEDSVFSLSLVGVSMSRIQIFVLC